MVLSRKGWLEHEEPDKRSIRLGRGSGWRVVAGGAAEPKPPPCPRPCSGGRPQRALPALAPPRARPGWARPPIGPCSPWPQRPSLRPEPSPASRAGSAAPRQSPGTSGGVHRVRGVEAAGAPGVAAATGGGVADKSTPPAGLAAVEARRQPTLATPAPTAALRLPSGPSAASSVRTSSAPPPTARLSTRTLVALG